MSHSKLVSRKTTYYRLRYMDGDMRNWANPQIGHFEIWTKKGKFIIIKSGIPK